MIIVIKAIIEKSSERNIKLFKLKDISKKFTKKYPAPSIRMFRKRRIREYLYRGFKKNHLIKPFMAVYIAANTPRRDNIIVKTGVSNPVSLSSLVPPHVVIRMIPII